MTYRLLFVCLGNICRSPSAENIMNHLIKQAGLQEHIFCDSAGTSDYHIGSSPDRRMTAAAARRGIRLRGQARQFQLEDFDKFELIIAMDRQNYRDILAIAPTEQERQKVRLMGEFAVRQPVLDIPDPYYGGTEGFERVIDLLLEACSNLLAAIAQNQDLQVRSTLPK